jgi:hypothetical protein
LPLSEAKLVEIYAKNTEELIVIFCALQKKPKGSKMRITKITKNNL